MSTETLEVIDWIIISTTLVGSLTIGLVAKVVGKADTQDYFLSGRSMSWPTIAASIFATNIGAEHFTGIVGAACEQGIAVALYEMSAIPIVLLLGFVFFPLFMRASVTTIPEFLELRFNSTTRLIVSITIIIFYALTKISATVYAGTLVFRVLLGINIYIGAGIIVLITAIYTIVGGMRSVIWTDTAQTVLFLGGGIAAFSMSLTFVSYDDVQKYVVQGANMPSFLSLFRVSRDYPKDADFEWSGMAFGAQICSLYYWCFDQNIVQRGFAARNATQARYSTIAAATLKLVPMFLMVVPGVVARTMYEMCKAGAGHNDWCGGTYSLDEADGANNAYLLLIARKFPVGVKGIIVSAILAAMLSSLSSVYNSSCTLFTVDIYQKFIHPAASERRLLFVARLVVLVLTAITFAWLPVMNNSESPLYVFIQAISAHLTPPIAAICLLGVFSWRCNGTGASVALASSFFLGLTHMALIVTDTVNGTPGTYAFLSYNHAGTVLFFFAGTVCMVVSLLSDPPPPIKVHQHVISLCWKSPEIDSEGECGSNHKDNSLNKDMEDENSNSNKVEISGFQIPHSAWWEKTHVFVLLAVLVFLYVYFR